MKKRIIVGNWKMNPTTLDEAKRLFKTIKNTAEKLKSVSVIICPPFVYIKPLLNSKIKSMVFMGAQNTSSEEQGSFTGEVSPLMLKDLGVDYVIVGHSEEREKGEIDEKIAKKIQILLELDINPILCIGEKERNEDGTHLEFLKNQIKNSLNKVSKKNISNLIFAYEPIWAIGAKDAMKSEDIYEISIFIKKVLSDIYGQEIAIAVKILYGGSVNSRNALEIFEKGQVNGLLVGRDSINSSNFIDLLKSVDF